MLLAKSQPISDFERQVKHTLEWSNIDPGVKDVLTHLMDHVSELARHFEEQA